MVAAGASVLIETLSELLRSDMNLAHGECRHCHVESALTDVLVESDESGLVALCPSCDRALITLMRGEQRAWLDLQGIAGLGVSRSAL